MQVSVKSSDFKKIKTVYNHLVFTTGMAWGGPDNFAWLLKELYILLVGFKIKLRFHVIKNKQLIIQGKDRWVWFTYNNR